MNRSIEADITVINPTSIYGLNYIHQSHFHVNKERFSSLVRVPRQFVYGHFVYDTSSTDISSTDISSTDISSTTVYQRTGQLYVQLLFQQIIIFINSNFYLHYYSLLSIPLPLPL